MPSSSAPRGSARPPSRSSWRESSASISARPRAPCSSARATWSACSRRSRPGISCSSTRCTGCGRPWRSFSTRPWRTTAWTCASPTARTRRRSRWPSSASPSSARRRASGCSHPRCAPASAWWSDSPIIRRTTSRRSSGARRGSSMSRPTSPGSLRSPAAAAARPASRTGCSSACATTPRCGRAGRSRPRWPPRRSSGLTWTNSASTIWTAGS